MSGACNTDENAAVVLRTALGDASLIEFPLSPVAAAKEAIDKMIRAGDRNACAFVGAWLPIRTALNVKCITREGVIHLALALLQQVVERRVVHPSVLVRLCDLSAIAIAGTMGSLADMALHMVRGSNTDLPFPEGALMRDQLAPGMLVFLLATLPYCARAVAAGAPGWQLRQLREVVDAMLRCSELITHIVAKLKLGASTRWGQAHGEALAALQSMLDAPLSQVLGADRGDNFLRAAAHVSVADLAAATTAATATPAATGEAAATLQVPVPLPAVVRTAGSAQPTGAAGASARGAASTSNGANAAASVGAAAAAIGCASCDDLPPAVASDGTDAEAEMDADAAVAQVLEDLAAGLADGGTAAALPQHSTEPAAEQHNAMAAGGSLSPRSGALLPTSTSPQSKAFPLSVGVALCRLTRPPLHDLLETLTAPLGRRDVATGGEVCFRCAPPYLRPSGDAGCSGHCSTHAAHTCMHAHTLSHLHCDLARTPSMHRCGPTAPLLPDPLQKPPIWHGSRDVAAVVDGLLMKLTEVS
jgi:hypothetical protein